MFLHFMLKLIIINNKLDKMKWQKCENRFLKKWENEIAKKGENEISKKWKSSQEPDTESRKTVKII